MTHGGAGPTGVEQETTDPLQLLWRGGAVAVLLLLPGALVCAVCPLWVPAVGPLAAFALASRGEVKPRAALELLRQRGPHAAVAFLVLGLVPLVWIGMVGQVVEKLRLGRDLTLLVGAAVSLPATGLLGAALAALPAQALLGPDADLVRAWRRGAGRRLEGALTFLLPACLVGVAFPLDLPWATSVPRGLRLVGFVGAALLAQLLLGLLCAWHHARGPAGPPRGGGAAPPVPARREGLTFDLPPSTLLAPSEGPDSTSREARTCRLLARRVGGARPPDEAALRGLLPELQALVGEAPTLAAAWGNLARAQRLLGALDEAAAALARARQLEPERADLGCEAGRLALARGELGEALRAFERAAARPRGEPGQDEGAACLARIEAELGHEGYDVVVP